jgi:hypothetical protein
MSNLNDKLNDSLLDIIGKAEQLGRNNARTQVLELFQSIIDKPEFESMTSIEVIRWLTQAINMEHHIEMMPNE